MQLLGQLRSLDEKRVTLAFESDNQLPATTEGTTQTSESSEEEDLDD